MSFERRSLGSGFVYNADGLVRAPQGQGQGPPRQQGGQGGRKSLKEQRAAGAKGPSMREKPLPSRPDRPQYMSYFSGIPAGRNELPIFNEKVSGVPGVLNNPVGYYYQYNRLGSDGAPMTMWFYYSQGDGPHADARFGDKLGGKDELSFWVRRPDHDGEPLTDKKAREFVEEPEEGKRVRGMTLGFSWVTSKRAPRGSNSRPGSRAGSNFGSRNASGFNTPRQFPANSGRNMQGPWSGVASGYNSGFQSGASSAYSTRPGSPDFGLFQSGNNSGFASGQASGYTSENDEWNVVVNKGKQKKERKGQGSKQKPKFQQLLSGGVDRELFFECDGNKCKCEKAWELSADLVPSNHFIRHRMDVTIYEDEEEGKGDYYVTISVDLPRDDRLLQAAVEYTAHIGKDIQDKTNGKVSPQMLEWYNAVKCEKNVSWADGVEVNTPDVVVENVTTSNPFSPLASSSEFPALNQGLPQRQEKKEVKVDKPVKSALKNSPNSSQASSASADSKVVPAPDVRSFSSNTPADVSKSVKLTEKTTEQKL